MASSAKSLGFTFLRCRSTVCPRISVKQLKSVNCGSCFGDDNRRLFTATLNNSTEKMENVLANPYYSKYADKIEALQKTSPEEFAARVGQLKQETKPVEKHDGNMPVCGISSVTAPKPLAQDASMSYVQDKKLDDVMKVDLIQSKSPDEISKIWQEYHRMQDKIIAVIPASVYSTIYERSHHFPNFLYPLPRHEGYEFFVAQFSGHVCHFTSLLNYQIRKENAPECLAIVHYTDFQESKGIVLMRGEYDKEIINGSEARCLANQVQLYYTAPPSERKHDLLKAFSLNPNNFKHEDLIKELQNITL